MSNKAYQKRRQEQFKKSVRSYWRFGFFLFLKMPIALLAGLRIRSIDDAHCTCSLPFKWLSQNPFRSIYFATQSMAAEMSTGALGLMKVQGHTPGVSMLVANMHGVFHKKATERIFFTCNEGEKIDAAIQRTIETGEGVEVTVHSEGKTKDGILISTFDFTWSFKVRSK
ncbi:MAG: DUF4442 domain-containing protein [Chitinophagales bacterium]